VEGEEQRRPLVGGDTGGDSDVRRADDGSIAPILSKASGSGISALCFF
jgi:hypothetical protein